MVILRFFCMFFVKFSTRLCCKDWLMLISAHLNEIYIVVRLFYILFYSTLHDVQPQSNSAGVNLATFVKLHDVTRVRVSVRVVYSYKPAQQLLTKIHPELYTTLTLTLTLTARAPRFARSAAAYLLPPRTKIHCFIDV